MISSLNNISPSLKGLGITLIRKLMLRSFGERYIREEKGSISVLFTDVNNDGHAFGYHKDY